ncbi:unnamed protein product [Moneuplotes crassus]|uniref:BZIP domain-containing protein n=1 Tax=Euplotes crassus TaxID=5936 RepID=A0AAD1XIA4_EUPCR|nr:unnamed protein product [Moneuplotes crassus]
MSIFNQSNSGFSSKHVSINPTPSVSDLNEVLGASVTSSKLREIPAFEEIEAIEQSNKHKKLEERRQKGRIRSKATRENKKKYLQQLEHKVAELEQEKFRLQNLLISYRADKLYDIGAGSKSPIENIQTTKYQTIEQFFDRETTQYVGNKSVSMAANFEKKMYKNLQNHKEFIDKAFEAIINSYNPNWKKTFQRDFQPEYTTDYKIIKKYSTFFTGETKLSKYQQQEFIKKHNLNLVDEFVASVNPSESQFALAKVIFKKYDIIHRKYKKAIQLLLEAKQIIEETNVDHNSFMKFLVESKIFEERQMMNSMLKNSIFTKDNAFKDIWQIKISKKTYTFNILDDHIMGEIARKVLKDSDKSQEVSFEYNHFSLP